MSTDTDATYTAAKADQVAALILDALHAQDAATYNGNAGDVGALALSTAKQVETIIRRDERDKLARLFEDHRDTLASFPKDAAHVVDMVCLLLRMGGPADG